jgi:ElaB/YqjD/DUF883 family membrane-anchored ribosome-binding protein
MAKGPGEVRQAIEEQSVALADVSRRARKKLAKNADQLQDKAGDVVSKVRDATPDQVESSVRATANSARRRPSVLAGASAFLVGLLVGRQLGRR